MFTKIKYAHARTICSMFGSMNSLRNKDRIWKLRNTMFIQPIIYARTWSEHFTFIRIDARITLPWWGTLPPVTYAWLTCCIRLTLYILIYLTSWCYNSYTLSKNDIMSIKIKKIWRLLDSKNFQKIYSC